jgi:hypothetical protein
LQSYWSSVATTLPMTLAFEPPLCATSSPQPEHFMFAVVCENTVVVALHFSHWTVRKLLRGLGIRIFSRFISRRSPACVFSCPLSWSFSGMSYRYSAMSSFLRSWLSSLARGIFGRRTPSCPRRACVRLLRPSCPCPSCTGRLTGLCASCTGGRTCASPSTSS